MPLTAAKTLFLLGDLDLRLLGGWKNIFPKMVVKNGDASHGRKSPNTKVMGGVPFTEMFRF